MKKLLQKVSEWLRSRVTAITKVKGERLKAKDTPSAYYNEKQDQTPDILSSFSLSSSSKGEASPLLLLIEKFIDEHYCVRLNMLSQQYEVCERGTERWTPVSGTLCNRILMELNRKGIILAMTGIERSTFGYYLTEYGAPQVRVNNKRLYGVVFN